MSKKQTAVDWLIEQVNSEQYQKAFGQTYISIAIIEQAKEIEKNQITDAFYDGYYQEDVKSFKTYYEQNFKSE